MNQFHLSLGVRSLKESMTFFQDVLGGECSIRTKGKGANVDVLGAQIFLKHNPNITADLADFHFGFNLSLDRFEALSAKILTDHASTVTMKPKTVDAGTPLERKKMFLKSPTGYTVELKGYRCQTR